MKLIIHNAKCATEILKSCCPYMNTNVKNEIHNEIRTQVYHSPSNSGNYLTKTKGSFPKQQH